MDLQRNFTFIASKYWVREKDQTKEYTCMLAGQAAAVE
jgi:hypothetical protein